MRTDAIFNIASMTKPVTSVAIMQLYEQGELKLDDPVSKYLPGFDKLQVITQFNAADGSLQTRPAKNVMTLRHLLTHTSGIGYGFTNPIVLRLQETESERMGIAAASRTRRQMDLQREHTRAGHGRREDHGMPLETYFQQNILEPLGMRDTSFAVPPPETVPSCRLCSSAKAASSRSSPPPRFRDAPGAFARRRRSLLHRARLRSLHSHVPQRRQARAMRAS